MFKDATAMAEAVQKRQVSPAELVQDAIDRIEQLNPTINAVVSKQYDEARAYAQTGHFDGKLFGGVPILLKDLGQNQKGQLSTSASRLFATHRASETDAYVKRVEELGFIILGRTNAPEFGFKNTSDSQLHGPVSLPKDLTRNAGGSSGGASAAVASGMVPIAGASDGGGSIRIPASFNGLIGLKPTRGRLPVGPSSYRGWQGASSHFAITKSVRDTRAFLKGMQVCQLESPFPLPTLSDEELSHVVSRPLTIGYRLESPLGTPVSKEAQAAVLEIVATLETLGHHLVALEKDPVDGVALMKAYYIMNSVETAQMFDEIEGSFGRVMTLDDMELMTWAIYQSGQKIPAKLYSKVLQDWDRYSAQMHAFHQTYDLLLSPTVADVAPKHGQFDLTDGLKADLADMASFAMVDQQDLIWKMFEHSLAWTPFTQLANLTGQPSISLPTYERADGLPIGIQLTAAKGREDLLLSLSEQLSQEGLITSEQG